MCVAGVRACACECESLRSAVHTLTLNVVVSCGTRDRELCAICVVLGLGVGARVSVHASHIFRLCKGAAPKSRRNAEIQL